MYPARADGTTQNGRSRAGSGRVSVVRSVAAPLRERLESLAGFSLRGIAVHHDSSEPSRIGAHAFTRGHHIHLAPNQERHLAHEVWHVAQQRAGRVHTTGRVGDLPVNDQPSLEREANHMAAAALPGGTAAMPLGLPAASGGAPAPSSPVQGMWIHRDGQRVEVPDDYVLQPGEERVESGGMKRARTEEPPRSPSVMDGLPDGFRRRVLSHLDVADAARLAQVSRATRDMVNRETVLPRLHGRREVGGTDFFTEQPASEEKRYFQQMSALGPLGSVPHVSEQAGHDPHITDMAAVAWPAPNGHLPGGQYPTKVQFPIGGDGTVGAHNLPSHPREGRVFTPAPSVAGEPPGTWIQTRDHPRALTVPAQGPLPPSRQRLQLRPGQERQRLADVQHWTGKRVIKRERPGDDGDL